MKLDVSRNSFEKKPSNIKFHENLCSGGRVVACGRTDGQTDRQTKLTVVFRNFANAPKNSDTESWGNKQEWLQCQRSEHAEQADEWHCTEPLLSRLPRSSFRCRCIPISSVCIQATHVGPKWRAIVWVFNVLETSKAQWSLYIPHSGHYTHRTAVTIRTAQWSPYVPHSGHYTYRQFNIQKPHVMPSQCTEVLRKNFGQFIQYLWMCTVMKLERSGQQIKNAWKVLKCGAGEGWRRSVGQIM